MSHGSVCWKVKKCSVMKGSHLDYYKHPLNLLLFSRLSNFSKVMLGDASGCITLLDRPIRNDHCCLV